MLLQLFSRKNTELYFCTGCGAKRTKESTSCTKCGGIRRTITTDFVEVINLQEVFFRIRNKRSRFEKFVYELIRRYKTSGDPKLPEGVYEERIVDKENDRYIQKVYKMWRGRLYRLLHYENESLSKHHK